MLILLDKFITNEYIIYCSPQQEKFLKHSKHWHIDSTFYAVPSSFYQLMVILIYDEDCDLYIPASFILCSHKNTEIYKKIRKLKHSIKLQYF